MISEDYVSYEVAKLLKEKGFDEATRAYFYGESEGFQSTKKRYNRLPITREWPFTEKWTARPTHQMAMKWFREEHNIHISLWIYGDHYNFSIHEFPESTDLSIEEDLDKQHEIKAASYEEAVEAALKYCLTELI